MPFLLETKTQSRFAVYRIYYLHIEELLFHWRNTKRGRIVFFFNLSFFFSFRFVCDRLAHVYYNDKLHLNIVQFTKTTYSRFMGSGESRIDRVLRGTSQFIYYFWTLWITNVNCFSGQNKHPVLMICPLSSSNAIICLYLLLSCR